MNRLYLSKWPLRLPGVKSRWQRLVEWFDGWRWGKSVPITSHNCSIPLGRAMWCMSCNEVVIIGSRCSTCQSVACMTLSTLLNRELERLVE